MNKIKVEYNAPWTPAIVNLIDKSYIAISGCQNINVPTGTTMDDLELINHWNDATLISNYKIGTFESPNSKGNGFYSIVSDGEQVTCNCVGFGFKRKCRHVDEFKLNFKN